MMKLIEFWSSIDKLVKKEVLVSGVPGESCGLGNDNGKCVVDIKTTSLEGNASEWVQQYNDLKEYFSSDFNGIFKFGESDTNIGRAFERCLQCMLPGEASLVTLTIKSHDDLVDVENNSAVGTICLQVSMKEILNERLLFELSGEEKYEIAMNNKARGIELFKSERYIDAFLRFSKGLKILISIAYDDNTTVCTKKDDAKSLLAVLYNNLASCQLKLNNFGHTATLCNKVLAVEPANIKALYRRAVANIALCQYDVAQKDLTDVLNQEPSNVAARNKLKEVNMITVDLNAKYTNVVKKMFEQDFK